MSVKKALHTGLLAARRRMLAVMPAGARANLRRAKSAWWSFEQLKRNQATLALRLARLEERGNVAAPSSPDPSVFPPGVFSQICAQAHLEQDWFREWCLTLGHEPMANRKLWEHAYISWVLHCMGMLEPGRRGIGFGVGTEPLVAAFAGRGCEILATDLPADDLDALAWASTGQHGNLEDLYRPDLCDRETFDRAVRYRPLDMRAIPTELRDFDFCWSSCSLEHLGSIEEGIRFIAASLDTLRPGGVAVHTTELNLTSDTHTVDYRATVLFRRSDIRSLKSSFEDAGHHVAPLVLQGDTGVLDGYVDVPPYTQEPHLRLLIGRYVSTSVALVVQKG